MCLEAFLPENMFRNLFTLILSSSVILTHNHEHSSVHFNTKAEVVSCPLKSRTRERGRAKRDGYVQLIGRRGGKQVYVY